MKIPPWLLLPFFLLLVVLDFLSALKRDVEPLPPTEAKGLPSDQGPAAAPARRSDQRFPTKAH